MNQQLSRFFLVIAAAVVLFATPTSLIAGGFAVDESDPDLDSLVVWVEGDYSSRLHHEHDSTYADIDLRIRRVWEEKTDGIWFYSEQAFADSPGKPFLQRLYLLKRVEEGMLEIIVYKIKEEGAVLGGWKNPQSFPQLTKRDLRLSIGCELYLQATGVSYIGGTHGTACRSDQGEMSYVLSEITIEYDKIVVWERGYDSADNQVWGSVEGPYWFFKE